MKRNLKKAVVAGLAATLVCSCFTGCKKKDNEIAVSEVTPIATPSISQSETSSAEHNITGSVDTSGGSQIISGKPVLT